MDITEMLVLTIVVVLIANGTCTPIGEGEGRMQWNSMFLREKKAISTDSQILTRRRRFVDFVSGDNLAEMREKSYEHTPQEFLRQFGPEDVKDVYEIFRALYLEAFTGEQPTHTVTDNKLVEMGNEFELSRCRKPRMKMIDLYEELGIAPDIVISPPVANVSRCGSNSGCCPKGQSCYHTGDNFKNKTITVLHIYGNDISVKRYNVLEHEECECTTLTTASSSAIPTVGHYDTSPFVCDKKCISLFKQDGYCQCNVCDPEKHVKCDRLKKGKRILSDDDAICVADGECEEPFCNPNLHYSPDDKKCMDNDKTDLPEIVYRNR